MSAPFQPRRERYRVWTGAEMLAPDDPRAAWYAVPPDGRLGLLEGPAGDALSLGLSEPAVALRSTGLRDAAGAEVFEGDVVGKADGGRVDRYTVRWDDEASGWAPYCWPDVDHDFRTVEYDRADAYRVAGNVFENPDLVEA